MQLSTHKLCSTLFTSSQGHKNAVAMAGAESVQKMFAQKSNRSTNVRHICPQHLQLESKFHKIDIASKGDCACNQS